MTMPNCAYCSASYQGAVYRNTLCPVCGKELKTCRNCRHFSPGAPNDCREPVSENVLDKDRANFCDWFSPSENAFVDKSTDEKQSRAKAAFEDLFNND